MRVVLNVLFVLGILVVLFLAVVLGDYLSRDARKKAELWYSMQKFFLQGSVEEDWLLQRSIEADSTFAKAYMQKSISYNKRGDFYQGMQLLNRAVDIDPIGYLGYRGFVKLYMLRDYEGAISDFLRLDSLTPGVRDAPWGEDIYYVIGLSYQQLGSPSKALAYFNLAIEEENGFIDDQMFMFRGIVQTELEQYDKAIKDLEQALQMNPMADQYYYLAYSTLKSGNTTKGCEYLAKGIERWKIGYYRYNSYYEMPGQVYLSDFYKLYSLNCE